MTEREQLFDMFMGQYRALETAMNELQRQLSEARSLIEGVQVRSAEQYNSGVVNGVNAMIVQIENAMGSSTGKPTTINDICERIAAWRRNNRERNAQLEKYERKLVAYSNGIDALNENLRATHVEHAGEARNLQSRIDDAHAGYRMIAIAIGMTPFEDAHWPAWSDVVRNVQERGASFTTWPTHGERLDMVIRQRDAALAEMCHLRTRIQAFAETCK